MAIMLFFVVDFLFTCLSINSPSKRVITVNISVVFLRFIISWVFDKVDSDVLSTE